MENKYVIFKLGTGEYGVDILDVKEVGEFTQRTQVPNSPDFVEGIINIRGDIVPVINLKKRFNLSDTSYDDLNRIIVVSVKNNLVAFLVDDTSQVISINNENIKDTPEIIATEDKKYIKGVANIDGKIVLLLKLGKVLNEDETELVCDIVS